MYKGLLVNYSSFSDFGLKNPVVLIWEKAQMFWLIWSIPDLKSPVKNIWRGVDSFPDRDSDPNFGVFEHCFPYIRDNSPAYLRNFLIDLYSTVFSSYSFPALSWGFKNPLTEVLLELGFIPLSNLPVFKPAAIKWIKVTYANLYRVPVILKSYIWKIDIPYSSFFVFADQDSPISEN